MSQPRSTGPTGTVQKIGNVQKTPKNPNKGNLGMSQNQRMTASPQTRGTDMRGGQPRATQNTMAGKSGGKRD